MCVPVSPAPALHKFIQMFTVATITIDCLLHANYIYTSPFCKSAIDLWSSVLTHKKEAATLNQPYIAHPPIIQKTSTLCLWRLIFFHCKSQKENQYFSSDFPSTSAECQHTHDPARAVLYSGAGNRIGEVLLDRIKRARP